MIEQWVSTRTGSHLARRSRASTAPEVLLPEGCLCLGGQFRHHPRIAKGCAPDFVLPRRRIAVFVEGCFWHGRPEHERMQPWTGPDSALWEDKLRQNAKRDKRSTQLAEEHGRHVVRVSELLRLGRLHSGHETQPQLTGDDAPPSVGGE